MATEGAPTEVSEGIKPQQQAKQPGEEHQMAPKPLVINNNYKGSGKLSGKVALITGGDSGIGRAVAVHFAREGAKALMIVYKDEHQDAQETASLVLAEKCESCMVVPGDVGDPKFCASVVEQCVSSLGGLDVLVNNAGEQHKCDSIMDITPEQLRTTFSTNLFSMFYLVRAALPHLKPGSSIINSTSVTAYRGSPGLLDYSSTKGGIVTFTRALAQQLASKGIRVNGVAPGPIWTPLIPASFDKEHTGKLGQSSSMKRAGQPSECAPAYVFLASDTCSSYITGHVMHPNGGAVVNV